MSYAIVDIGSASARYLAFSDDGTPIGGSTTITRLGAGLAATGYLEQVAIDRAVDAVQSFRRANPDITEWHALTTAAVREARNGADALAALTDVVGRPPVVLSSDDEGRLAFAGAIAGLAPSDGTTLVVDIGGASTEFTLGTTAGITAVHSLPLGSLRLTEAELSSDPPRPEELSNAVGAVYDHLDDVLREMPGAASADRVVGVGGTITTIAAVEIGLPVYDRQKVHGFELTHDAAEDVFRTLATESLAQRLHNPGLPADRAPFIVGGCCIAVGVLRRLHYGAMVVSASNVLDGFAARIQAERALRSAT